MTTQNSVSVQATLIRDNEAIEVQYQVINKGKQPIYVYDRLWKVSNGQYVLDPEGAYRSFENGKLSLLLGAAPLPTDRLPTFRNESHVRRVEGGCTLSGHLFLKSPVREHNCYFNDADLNTTLTRARSVELFVELVEAERVSTQPSAVAPDALKITAAGVFDKRRTIRSGEKPIDVEVLRRTHQFSRIRTE